MRWARVELYHRPGSELLISFLSRLRVSVPTYLCICVRRSSARGSCIIELVWIATENFDAWPSPPLCRQHAYPSASALRSHTFLFALLSVSWTLNDNFRLSLAEWNWISLKCMQICCIWISGCDMVTHRSDDRKLKKVIWQPSESCWSLSCDAWSRKLYKKFWL